jgi:hypothetical protein
MPAKRSRLETISFPKPTPKASGTAGWEKIVGMKIL